MKSSALLLTLIVFCAFVLRAWNLSAQSLDIDEYSEILITEKTYTEAALSADSMPPLFPVLHKACRALRPHDMTGRWLSLAAGVATVWVVGSLWRQCFGDALALATAALIAFSPLHIYYSQYTRSYGLMMLWTALVIGALTRAVTANRRADWALFIFAALGGLNTHYYFAIFLAVASFTVAVWAYGWRWSRQFLIANASVFVLALPLIGFVGKDLHFQKGLRDSRPLDVPALGYTYVSMLTGYSVGPSKRDLQVLGKREALVAALPIAAIVGAIFLTLGYASLSYLRKRKLFIVLFVLSVAPVLAIGLLGVVSGVTYNPRFVVWSLLPLLAILAAGIVHGHRWWSVQLATVLLIFVSVWATYNRQSVDDYQNEDVRSLGSYLTADSSSRLPVFVVSNYMVPAVKCYLPEDVQVLELPSVEATNKMKSTTELVGLAEKTLTDAVSENRAYWLVYTRPFHGDPQDEILAHLTDRDSLQKVKEFAGIVLYKTSPKQAVEKPPKA